MQKDILGIKEGAHLTRRAAAAEEVCFCFDHHVIKNKRSSFSLRGFFLSTRWGSMVLVWTYISLMVVPHWVLGQFDSLHNNS